MLWKIVVIISDSSLASFVLWVTYLDLYLSFLVALFPSFLYSVFSLQHYIFICSTFHIMIDWLPPFFQWLTDTYIFTCHYSIIYFSLVISACLFRTFLYIYGGLFVSLLIYLFRWMINTAVIVCHLCLFLSLYFGCVCGKFLYIYIVAAYFNHQPLDNL